MDKFRNVTLVDKQGNEIVATSAVDLNNYLYTDGMTPKRGSVESVTKAVTTAVNKDLEADEKKPK